MTHRNKTVCGGRCFSLESSSSIGFYLLREGIGTKYGMVSEKNESEC